MKVIFLDVDGVLNSLKTCIANGGYPFKLEETEAFDMHAIKLLQRFCDSSGAVIVMSSAWRLHYPTEAFAEAWDLPVIDSTISLWGCKRGEEIQEWLNRHPDVTHYAILDDNDDMLDIQSKNFVHTNENEGFTWANFLMMCNILEEHPLQGVARDRNWRIEKNETT